MPIRDDRLSPSGPRTRLDATATIDFPSIAAQTVAVQTATITNPGLAVTDQVLVLPQANLPAGLSIAYARVSAANTLTVALANVTAGAVDPPALTFDVIIFR